VKFVASSSSRRSACFPVRPARRTLADDAMISTPKLDVYAWIVPAMNMASSGASADSHIRASTDSGDIFND
jgi:hypothetical protein